MQRRRHVDTARIVVCRLEGDVLGPEVRADTFEEEAMRAIGLFCSSLFNTPNPLGRFEALAHLRRVHRYRGADFPRQAWLECIGVG